MVLKLCKKSAINLVELCPEFQLSDINTKAYFLTPVFSPCIPLKLSILSNCNIEDISVLTRSSKVVVLL